MDLDYINQWVGKEQTTEAIINPEPANLMNAALNREPTFAVGDPLPPAWHWLYFHEGVRGDGLGIEGHEQLGGFMPPIYYAVDEAGDPIPPRRMWAGGLIEFLAPIPLGASAAKTSAIQSITPKEGRSGKLCFVVVAHEIGVDGRLCLREEQTIVYRDIAKTTGTPVQANPAPESADFSTRYTPDPILLFRYSALTFNAHRIHYDVDFCRQHEGYPDLVVHGPLTATLLLDLYYNAPEKHNAPEKRPNQTISHFTYRGLAPLFNSTPFTINGTKNGDAWAANHEGGLAMTAKVTLG